MSSQEKRWDFFIAYAGLDHDSAQKLHDILSRYFCVFSASRSLSPGDDWDRALASAQRNSLVTLVLISSKTDAAYYQREQIAAALDMARRDEDRHRVVPLLLEEGLSADSLPYGLRLKHSVSVSDFGGLEQVAEHSKRSLLPTFAMAASDIEQRHYNRSVLQRAIRLVPENQFDRRGRLGKTQQQYVFLGDYEEQRYRTLRDILSNLMMGDGFEPVPRSDVEWIGILFEVGKYQYHKLDVLPATWKAVFRILSDPKRMACFQTNEEEKREMGSGLKNYYSDDQGYWYNRLTIRERGAFTSLPLDKLGIFNLCFDGLGIVRRNVPSSEATFMISMRYSA